MKKILSSLILTMPLAWCLVGCASNTNGADPTANVTSNDASSSTNTVTSNIVTNTVTSDAATNTATSNATDTSSNTAASPVAASPKKTYHVVDEAQAGYPAAIASAIHKLTVPPPPASMKVPDKARLLFSTSKGDITVELNGKAAPLHVKSFIYLTQKGFYNGTTFHRYVPGFVIQGGDPFSKTPTLRAMAGAGGPGYTVPREYNSLKHDAMVIAMARTQDPDSAGSQFYFTLAPQTSLDQENSQDGVGYTVFGKVLKGQNVVLQLRQDDVLKRVTVLK